MLSIYSPNVWVSYVFLFGCLCSGFVRPLFNSLFVCLCCFCLLVHMNYHSLVFGCLIGLFFMSQVVCFLLFAQCCVEVKVSACLGLSNLFRYSAAINSVCVRDHVSLCLFVCV